MFVFAVAMFNDVNIGVSFPSFLTPYLTVQLQIEEVSRRLRTGELGINPNPEERFDV